MTMPICEIEPYIEDHPYADSVEEAHPIDDDIIATVSDKKLGPYLLHYQLAMVQHVAPELITDRDGDGVTFARGVGYDRQYVTDSGMFYHILSRIADRIDDYITVEFARPIVDAHTKQYVRNVHSVEYDQAVDMDEVTLCHAMNEAGISEDELPFDHKYGFIDARGLVVEDAKTKAANDE